MYHLTTFLSEMMTHFAVPFLRTDVYILRGYGSSLIYLLSVKLSLHLPPLQISPASASSTLSDRSRFKKYFRTFPTFEIFAPAVLSLLEHYNWSRIVFLTQNENLFNNVSHIFVCFRLGGWLVHIIKHIPFVHCKNKCVILAKYQFATTIVRDYPSLRKLM